MRKDKPCTVVSKDPSQTDVISQRMPLTPAERQRRRREKLKMQEQRERYKAIDLTGVRCGVEVVPAWLKSWGLTAEALHATFKGLGLQIIRELCARTKPAPARVRLHLLAARFSRAMCADLCHFIESCLVRLSSEPLILPRFMNHLNDVGGMPGVLGIKVKDKDKDISVEEDGRYSVDGTPVDLVAKFPCSQCSFSLSTMAAWQLHMESHRPVSSNKRHKCSTCPYSTDDKSSFRLHARVHTGERPYTCGVCGKTFSQSSHRWQHMRIHNNDRPHSCAVCSKTFNRLTTLQQHTRIHTGERPFVCTMCAKTFSHPSALQQHVRIHTGERPHSCAVCSRTFSRPSALHQHARIHTGERPYTCTLCGKAFRQIAHCRNHMACCKYLKECNKRTIDSPEETAQLSISM
uniref:C2H2-type domain-containing protein n=1 Tax=Eptatretus burgeri TaxID=7764 RepID=A0A8C4NAD3_EPTBU